MLLAAYFYHPLNDIHQGLRYISKYSANVLNYEIGRCDLVFKILYNVKSSFSHSFAVFIKEKQAWVITGNQIEMAMVAIVAVFFRNNTVALTENIIVYIYQSPWTQYETVSTFEGHQTFYSCTLHSIERQSPMPQITFVACHR